MTRPNISISLIYFFIISQSLLTFISFHFIFLLFFLYFYLMHDNVRSEQLRHWNEFDTAVFFSIIELNRRYRKPQKLNFLRNSAMVGILFSLLIRSRLCMYISVYVYFTIASMDETHIQSFICSNSRIKLCVFSFSH